MNKNINKSRYLEKNPYGCILFKKINNLIQRHIAFAYIQNIFTCLDMIFRVDMKYLAF